MSQFLEAVKRGDTQTVAELLRSRHELVRFADEYGKTGLHWAAEVDQVEVAQLLLDAGADIEATTSWGATPLDWAATMGSARVAELLLARGASGFTLIVAAASGSLKKLRRSLRRAPISPLIADAALRILRAIIGPSILLTSVETSSRMRCTRLLATVTHKQLSICWTTARWLTRKVSSAARQCTGPRSTATVILSSFSLLAAQAPRSETSVSMADPKIGPRKEVSHQKAQSCKR